MERIASSGKGSLHSVTKRTKTSVPNDYGTI